MSKTTAPNLDEAIGGPPNLVPLVRPVPLRSGATGRVFTAGLDADGNPAADGHPQVTLRVTDNGHWWLSTDRGPEMCRGCRADDTFGARCPRPATAQDIASALLASVPRPAPVAPRALYAGVSA